MYTLIKTFTPKLVSGTTEGTYGAYDKSEPQTTAQSGGRFTPRTSTLKHSTSASSDFVLLREVESVLPVESTMHKPGISVDTSASRDARWPLPDEPAKF